MLAHELDALRFLRDHGPDCIGEIDTEEKLAAAVVFCNLKTAGLVDSELTPDGPAFRLTPAGRSALNAKELN